MTHSMYMLSTMMHTPYKTTIGYPMCNRSSTKPSPHLKVQILNSHTTMIDSQERPQPVNSINAPYYNPYSYNKDGMSSLLSLSQQAYGAPYTHQIVKHLNDLKIPQYKNVQIHEEVLTHCYQIPKAHHIKQMQTS